MTEVLVSTTPTVATGRTNLVRALLKEPVAVVSAAVIVVIVVVGLLSRWIEPHNPQRAVIDLVNSSPGASYLLGGDASGRDILSRLMASIDTMMLFAVFATATAVIVGVGLGLIAGYAGGTIDNLLSWVIDVIMAIPGIIILIGIFAVFGSASSIASAVVFGILMAVGSFRLTRTLVITVKNELYVDAARVSGLSTFRILTRHVLVVIRAPIIIQSAFAASTSIGVQAGLQFLGIGDPNVPSWGGMLQDAFLNLYVNPLAILWPGLALTVIISALVLFGNSLRDVLEGQSGGAKSRRRRSRRALASATATSAPTVASTPAPRTVDESVLLSVDGLSIGYPSTEGALVPVVEDVSLELRRGEILGLVGESGAGKSQTAFSILGLLAPQAVITSGSIRVAGHEVVGLDEKTMTSLRGSVIGYVPQEPLSNLDPSFTVGSQLVYGIRAVTGVSKKGARAKAIDMLRRVGIPDPERMFRSYPHQISGGMAQRALIAGAVACNPRLLIADEPTTALDVTVQAEILDLLRDLQSERGMGVVIVTHNFGVVADLCDRVAVMRNGRIVEQGTTTDIFESPRTDYTLSLLDAIISESEVRGDLVPPLVAQEVSR